jgi:radical SAM enzyme (TIGR01210 family)
MKHPLLTLLSASAAERDAWILARRPERNFADPLRPYEFLAEEECAASGEVVPVATIFLTNRECPWRCLMCDLWRNTLTESVPAGAIPTQITYALQRLEPARHIKLYNSGSFFDRKAIPYEDYAAIAEQVTEFERVIVECHPALVDEHCIHFRDLIAGRLEVAMGLETAHPEILQRLNKRMNLEQFEGAAQFLRKNNIDLRVFILVKPPFMDEEEALEWAGRSLEFAFDCGATAATLIPTRGGNGAMEELAAAGLFSPPKLATLETAMADGIAMRRGRVFADLWDVKRKASCEICTQLRIARLHAMNLEQWVQPPVHCDRCGGLS